MMNPTQWLRDIVVELRNLAAPAEMQRAYLESLGVSPLTDELALEYNDSFLLADQFRDAGVITPAQFGALEDVDQRLEQMSGPGRPSLWSVDALGGSDWQGVRQLAQEALNTLQAEARVPIARAS